MADIFISYAHEDQAFVKRMVPALEAEGFSVWWDHTIPPGKTWHTHIARGLEEAKACIIVWSTRSVQSKWVLEEATIAGDSDKLLPVQIAAVTPPMGFRRLQAAQLSGWNGDRTDAQFQLLVSEARTLVDGGVAPAAPAQSAQSRNVDTASGHGVWLPGLLIIAAVSAFAFLALALGDTSMQLAETGPAAETTESEIATTAPMTDPAVTEPATIEPPISAPAAPTIAHPVGPDWVVGVWSTDNDGCGSWRRIQEFRRESARFTRYSGDTVSTLEVDPFPILYDSASAVWRSTAAVPLDFRKSGNDLIVNGNGTANCVWRRID